MARILAIDYGTKRTGLAVTDPLQMIANGLTTVPTQEVYKFIGNYLRTENVECFVVGLPKQMNNLPSETMGGVEKMVDTLRNKFPGIPVKMVDERFTSQIAFQTMIDGGLKKKARQNKELVDTISATLILQSYLEQQRIKKG